MLLSLRISLFAVLLGVGAPSFACKPSPVSPEILAQVYPNMVEIFAGRVVELKHDESTPKLGRVRFVVEEVYKGAPKPTTWYGYHRMEDMATCAHEWPIALDQSVIVFVLRHKDDVWAGQPYGLGDDREMLRAAMRLLEKKP